MKLANLLAIIVSMVLVRGVYTTAAAQETSCVLPEVQAHAGPYLSALETELATGVAVPRSTAATLAQACEELGPAQHTRCAVARLTDQNESQSWSVAALCAQAWWTLGGVAELPRILQTTTRRLAYAANDPQTLGARTDIACNALESCSLDPAVRKRVETMCADGLVRVSGAMEGFLAAKNSSLTWFAISIATAVRGLPCTHDPRGLGRALAAATSVDTAAMGTPVDSAVVEIIQRVHDAASLDSEPAVGLLLMAARALTQEATAKYDRELLQQAMTAAQQSRNLAKAPDALVEVFEALAYVSVIACQWDDGQGATADCLLRATGELSTTSIGPRKMGGETAARIEAAVDGLLGAYLRTNPNWRNETKACHSVRNVLATSSAETTPLGAVVGFLARFYTTKDVTVSQVDVVVSRIENSKGDLSAVCKLDPWIDMKTAVATDGTPTNRDALLSRIGGLQAECGAHASADADVNYDKEFVKKGKKKGKKRTK